MITASTTTASALAYIPLCRARLLPLRELYIQLFHGVSLLNSNGGVPTLPGQEEEQPDDRQIVHDGRDAEHTAHNVLERVKQRQRGQHRVEGRQQPRRAQPEQNEQHDSPHAEHRAPAVSRLQITPTRIDAMSTTTIKAMNASRLPVVNMV